MILTDAVTEVNNLLKEPFTTPLDIWQVFAVVGLVIVSIVAWNMILFHVRIAAEDVI